MKPYDEWTQEESESPLEMMISEWRAYKGTGLTPVEVVDIMALSEKMNVCDLVRENLHISNSLRHTEAEVVALKAKLEKAETELARYQIPLLVIQESWNPSKCPRCEKLFYDYEPCDDGYYSRATSLERCPYCGQKINWYRRLNDNNATY